MVERNGGKIEGKALGGWSGPGWTSAQEHDTKSARALWVGLPCFCSCGSGMCPLSSVNKSPDVAAESDLNLQLSSSESQKRPFKESHFCPHPSVALHTGLKDRGRSQMSLPLPRKSFAGPFPSCC